MLDFLSLLDIWPRPKSRTASRVNEADLAELDADFRALSDDACVVGAPVGLRRLRDTRKRIAAWRKRRGLSCGETGEKRR